MNDEHMKELFLEVISETRTEQNHHTTQVDKAKVVVENTLMTNKDGTKALQPGEQPLTFPSSYITLQRSSVLGLGFLAA